VVEHIVDSSSSSHSSSGRKMLMLAEKTKLEKWYHQKV
jgi:hypothetical protein